MQRVAGLNVFKVKGMKGYMPESIMVTPSYGVAGDRTLALAKDAHQPAEAWAPKEHFYMGVNTPALMAVEPPPLLREDTLKDAVRGLEGVKSVTPVDTKGMFNMTDVAYPSVSLLNLRTLRAFSRWAYGDPHAVDPRRFRMNIHVEGLPAHRELDWVVAYPRTRRVRIGGVLFEVVDACGRCAATTANPDSGARDMPGLLKKLHAYMRRFGYRRPVRADGKPASSNIMVMGVYLRPLGRGTIRVGDGVALLRERKGA